MVVGCYGSSEEIYAFAANDGKVMTKSFSSGLHALSIYQIVQPSTTTTTTTATTATTTTTTMHWPTSVLRLGEDAGHCDEVRPCFGFDSLMQASVWSEQCYMREVQWT